MPRPPRRVLDTEEFAALAARLTGGRTSQTANSLRGIATVRTGHVVSMGDFPVGGTFASNQWLDDGGEWRAVNDRVELDIHGASSLTHIDSAAHFSWDRGTVRHDGDPLLALARSGLVGRGVLVDVPSVGVGEVITLDDVLTALAAAELQPEPGDALFIRFGREGAVTGDVPIGSRPTSGLSIECAEWLASAAPSVVITDEGLDSTPSEVDGLPVPWHLLLLTVLGVPLVDRAQLTELAARCETEGRWEFLSVIAPLPMPAVSGSPVNPLAVF